LNQAVNANKIRAAELQPFTTLLAMSLTVREALVVETAASVAKITKAKDVARKIRPIIALALSVEAAALWP
jgi:hypothetical protein